MGQLSIKRLVINKPAFYLGLFYILLLACSNARASEHKDQPHSGHSDDLLILLQHKIALQKLQTKVLSKTMLSLQAKHIQQVMPVLRRYMAIPKSYYLTTDMYHESLENRAAMLSDFSNVLIQYQKLLVSLP